MISVDDVSLLVTQLEGPYKWYVLGVILVSLTAIMTKVIFKTFKWFLLLAALAVIGLLVVNYFWPIEITRVMEEGSDTQAETEIQRGAASDSEARENKNNR